MFLIGVLFAGLAAVAYGLSTVLRALGARRAAVSARGSGATPAMTTSGGPSMSSTVATLRDRAFLVGTALVILGFVGGAVAARFLPLFLSQTIVSGNLVITALLGTLVLGTRLHLRDWIAIGIVVASLCALGFSSSHHAHDDGGMAFHWGLLAATLVLSAGVLWAVRTLGPRSAIVGGAAAGTLFGVIAIAVRVLHGVGPLDLAALFTDPAAYTIAIAGSVGFYVQTVALQLGAVNGVTAVLVVGETGAPGIIGAAFLGDSAIAGRTWLAVVGFLGAVVGAMLVAWYGSVDADHFGEAPPSEGGWRRRSWQREQDSTVTTAARVIDEWLADPLASFSRHAHVPRRPSRVRRGSDAPVEVG